MESFGTANGWVAVLISLGAAVFLPLITMGITAFCLPRTTVQNSEVHWAERPPPALSFQSSQDHFHKCPAGPLCYRSQFLSGYGGADPEVDVWFSDLSGQLWFNELDYLVVGTALSPRAGTVLGTSAKHSGSHLSLRADLSFRDHGCHSFRTSGTGSVQLFYAPDSPLTSGSTSMVLSG
jgi:hypothetical protein